MSFSPHQFELTTCAFRGFLKTEADLANNYDVHKPVDFIEDAACQDEDMIRVLRLMCLQSQISNGLKPKSKTIFLIS